MSQNEPERTAGYQQLIINSSQNQQEGRWLIYNRHFRLKASATGSKDWSTIEINIWNLAFPERSVPISAQRTPRYHGRDPTLLLQPTSTSIGMIILVPVAHILTAGLSTAATGASSTAKSRITDTRHSSALTKVVDPLLDPPPTSQPRPSH